MDNLELVRDLAVQAALANQFVDGETPDAVALPKDTNLHSLESYAPTRRRFRGTLNTQSLTDFAAYVQRHEASGSHAAGFVNVSTMAANVIFDLGDTLAPGHCSWQANLHLQPTAAYRALQEVDGKPCNQKQLTDWLEDWCDVLEPSFTDGKNSLSRAVVAIRKLKISEKRETGHEQGDFAARRSTLEDIEAKSSDALPPAFEFTTPPYEGLESRIFTLRLSVRTGDETPTLVLRWQQKETQIEEIAHEFRDVLAEKLGAGFPLTLGTFTP